MSDWSPAQCQAERLHQLLSFLDTQGKNEPIARAIQRHLNLDAVDDGIIATWIADLHRLISEAAAEVRALPRFDEQLMLGWHDGVLGAWQTMFQTPGNNMVAPKAHLTDLVLFQLQKDAADVRFHAPMTYFDHDGLEKVQVAVREAIAELKEATDVPHGVREYILARLNEVDSAINNYGVLGPNAIFQATDAMVGSVVQVAPDEGRSRIGEIAGRVMSALSFARRSTAEIEGTAQSMAGVLQIMSGDAPQV